ncbi:MAG: hypothetical protein Q8P11_00275 [bacterium]|nr:hypothetical protein [bacterium]
MTTRTKLILIGGGIVVVLAIVGAIIFMRPDNTQTPLPEDEQTQVTPQDTTTVRTDTTPVTSTTDNPAARVPATPLEPAESDLIAIAVPFVERLGSFSNQGNGKNLEILLPFMTQSLKTWATDKIAEVKSVEYQPIYAGTTTTVLSYHVASMNDIDAQITMTVQRKESVGTVTNSKVYNQDATIQMMKEGSVWLVDSVDWKE